MKLELLVQPTVSHPTLGRNFPTEAVAEFDSSKKKLSNAIDVLSDTFLSATRHIHFAFYFELQCDALTEILCYSRLTISRDEKDNETDCGIMSGSLDDFYHAALIFCRKETNRTYRGFFNAVLAIIEASGVTLPFRKVDLGDSTYSVKND